MNLSTQESEAIHLALQARNESEMNELRKQNEEIKEFLQKQKEKQEDFYRSNFLL